MLLRISSVSIECITSGYVAETSAIFGIRYFLPVWHCMHNTRVLRTFNFVYRRPLNTKESPSLISSRCMRSLSGSCLRKTVTKAGSDCEDAFGFCMCFCNESKISTGKIISESIGRINDWKVPFHSAPWGALFNPNCFVTSRCATS